MKSQLEGEIVFDQPPQLPPGTVVRIALQDTSEADAPAKVVAELVLKGAAREANERGRVRFVLPFEPVDERASLTLSAHVDLNGGGRLQKGDYINMQSYPVSAVSGKRQRDELSVHVEQVKA